MGNDKLITENMGYVITLARQYKSDILSTDDLVSEGVIGMMKAAGKFDPSRGKPFVTFAAPYIRKSIEDAISRLENDTQVRSTDESIPIGSHNNYTLLNVLEDKDAAYADAVIEQQTLSSELLRVIDILNEREQAVISRFYGIHCERQSMFEIGQVLGLKRERIRQIRNTALRKLQKKARQTELEQV